LEKENGEMKSKRSCEVLVGKMKDSGSFFKEFGLLDDEAFKEGLIPKKYKELAMVAMSIQSKCSGCIDFHVSEALKAGAIKDELIEAVKMGMMAGGSLTYPYIRHIFDVLLDAGII
jgi:AhpD family alkylhydroperoxidase